MKKLFQSAIYVALNLILILSFPACDLLEDAKSIDFDIALQEDFLIDADEGDGTNFSQQLVLDATSDPDIRDNLSKIENYSIEKITYSISGYSGGPENFFSGSIQFSDLNSSSGQFSASLENINLSAAAGAGERTLPLSDNDLRELESILKNANGLKVFMFGNFTEVPVSFVLNLRLSAKVEADAT